jgi:hypothetical protein
LQVIVCPEQLVLLPVRRTLSWRGGLRHTLHDPHSLPCNSSAGGPPWRAALQALEAALPEFKGDHPSATVILSNHFMRYTLVPWSETLASAEEELAFARHCFTRVFGQVAERWVLRLDPGPTEAPRLASATDEAFLDGLRGVFEGAGVTLKSIQPHLMAAFNGFRGSLRQRSAWFALLEPGNLCLALLDRERWVRVRNLRIGSTWREALPTILEREAYLAGQPDVPHEVYLWDAESEDAVPPQMLPWEFHMLSPERVRGGATPGRWPFLATMAG